MQRRTILIGDIHGCLDEFDRCLQGVGYKKDQDRLVLLGDLIDRGPDPLGVVRRAREIGAESVLGNHEEKLLRWRRHEARRRDTGKVNPMAPLSDQRRREWESFSEEDLVWLNGLPIYLPLTEDRYPRDYEPFWVAVHAGLEPALRLYAQKSERVIRLRFVGEDGLDADDGTFTQPEGSFHWAEKWRGPQSVVYGHAVHSRQDPRIDHLGERTCVGLDTGCVFGGHLTALILKPGVPGLEFYQVKAAQEYHSWRRYAPQEANAEAYATEDPEQVGGEGRS